MAAVFARVEYLERMGRVKRRMADAGVECLLVSSPANMNWLTGYDGQSFYTHQMAVVSADQEEPVWIGRGLDLTGGHLTAFMARENIVGYPDLYVGGDRHPMEFIAAYIKDKGWARGRVAVEMDEYYYSAASHAALAAALGADRLVDAKRLVNWARMKKSPAELALMREAGRIAETAIAAAIAHIRPGIQQTVAMGELYRAQILGADGKGGDFPCKAPNIGTGERAKAVHLHWEDKAHALGETTWLETCGVRHHYHAPLSRTVHLGEPPAKLAALAAGMVEGLEAALAAAKPGASCGEVAEAWGRVARRHGIEKATRIGYPVGVSYAPNWGELTASIRPGDRTVLEEGMSFHMIPGIWAEDATVVISESFEVTPQGGKTFANFPRKLIVQR